MFGWFYNLQTKVKLMILSFTLLAMIVVVAATSYYSNLMSITAAQDINTVLTRSYTRVNNLHVAMRKFDNDNIAYLSGQATISVDQFNRQMKAELNTVVQTIEVMNPNRIGDLPSSPEYAQTINDIKNLARTLPQIYQNFTTVLERDRIEALRAYFDRVRPIVGQIYSNCFSLANA